MSDDQSDAPIIIEGPEQSLVDPALADAGLPPVVGVQSFQVFRASKAVPEITDQKGWTYHHHVDMACWRGRLYVGWNSCQRDEDVWPSRELYSTSIDGRTWTDPVELFPQGVSTPLRMYFFLAPNGRMLAIAGMRVDEQMTDEDTKGGLVVREIRADHTFGEVYLLRFPNDKDMRAEAHTPACGLQPACPTFDQSRDSDFVDACRALLANTIFLEQQDRGRLLGNHRMKWHDAKAWPGGKVPGDNEKWVCGKAFSFFNRPDGVRVGVCKMGYVTTSTDGGETWSMPVIPPTLVTGKAKVWSQQTSDGKYALVYNPSTRNRFPLIVVTGDDGVRYKNMRLVQGELPVQRYPGMHRSIGPQYTRGISEWSNDGSRAGENAMWLVYSMNKEDIWVSQVPLPVKADETRNALVGFQDWNQHVPKWASASVTNDTLRLENRDPHDYVSATRVFKERSGASISFDLLAEQDGGLLSIEVLSKFGSRVVQSIRSTDLSLKPGEWKRIEIDASAEHDQPLHRISFFTGEHRNIGGANPVPIESDRPTPSFAFRIKDFRLI